MQAIIFMGIQGSGKTTFYAQNFLKTHVRISLDLLKTRGKEKAFMNLCLMTGQRFVIDNTNPRMVDRKGYIVAAKEARFAITGYFFDSSVSEAIERNNRRTGKEIISVVGIRATYKKLQAPAIAEGFNRLFHVVIAQTGFVVTEIT